MIHAWWILNGVLCLCFSSGFNSKRKKKKEISASAPHSNSKSIPIAPILNQTVFIGLGSSKMWPISQWLNHKGWFLAQAIGLNVGRDCPFSFCTLRPRSGQNLYLGHCHLSPQRERRPWEVLNLCCMFLPTSDSCHFYLQLIGQSWLHSRANQQRS